MRRKCGQSRSRSWLPLQGTFGFGRREGFRVLQVRGAAPQRFEAPLTKVIFTTFLYVSLVQIIPACDHTGTPLQFHSSTTSPESTQSTSMA